MTDWLLYLSAWLLLAAPVPDDLAYYVASLPRVPPALSSPLQTVAIRLEIMDVRETGYWLVANEVFASDVSGMRKRYRDLLGAPPLRDCMMFPDNGTAYTNYGFNRLCHQYLTVWLGVHPSNDLEIRLIMEEMDDACRIWGLIRRTTYPTAHVWERRNALNDLKKELGEVDYYSGRYPQPVPLHRFRRAD